MRCTICGKPAMMGGLCHDCFIKKNPIVVIPNKFEVLKCNVCNRFFVNNRWVKGGNVIQRLILKKIKFNSDFKDINTKIRLSESRVFITVSGRIKNQEFQQKLEKKIKIKITQCNSCSQKSSQSFEAILQLRGASVEKVYSYANKQVLKNPDIHIVKAEKLREGIDLYFSSSSFAVSLVRKMVKRFGGIAKFNKKLYSLDHLTSKLVYRTSILFRVFPFYAGEIVKIENINTLKELSKKDDLLKIIDASRLIKAFSIKTGHKITLKHSEDFKFKKLKKETVLVSQTKPKVKVLHPETYQPVGIENEFLLEHKNEKKNLEVVIDDDLIYVVDV